MVWDREQSRPDASQRLVERPEPMGRAPWAAGTTGHWRGREQAGNHDRASLRTWAGDARPVRSADHDMTQEGELHLVGSDRQGTG